MVINFDDKILELKKTFEKQQKLINIFKILSSEMDLHYLLTLIMEESSNIMEAERSTIFLLDFENDELYSKVAQGTQEIRFKNGLGIAGYVCKTGEIINIPDAYSDDRFNPEIDKKTGFRTRNILCVPMRNAEHEITGVTQVLNKKNAPFNHEDEELLLALASGAAIFVENARLYTEIENLFESIVSLASRAIDDRDPCTAGHSKRVNLYTMNLAHKLNEKNVGPYAEIKFDSSQLKELKYSALMHDFGKIGVREHVLSKASKITPDRLEVIRLNMELKKRDEKDPELAKRYDDYYEFLSKLNVKGFMTDEELSKLEEIREEGFLSEDDFIALSVRKGNLSPKELEDMRSHVVKSANMLKTIPWPKRLSNVPHFAGTHHEKLNGMGYPDGLPAEKIPIEARILAIADIYDALTAEDRPYKPAIPHEKAKTIMEFMVKDGDLDRELVEIFFDEECYKI
jgi:HD-GYP domain-containing protein (c-di-GMP phosphodiesterase class II)